MRFVCAAFLLVTIAFFVINEAESTIRECVPGQVKPVNCNSCKCIGNGFWKCTKRRCVQKREITCTPGERFKKDCNWCTCTRDGRNAYCTLIGCASTSRIHYAV